MKTPPRESARGSKQCTKAALQDSRAALGTPYEQRMAHFCRAAVKRSLLLGSLSSLGLSTVGCSPDGVRSGPAPKTDAPKTDISRPLPRGDASSIRSTEAAAPFPCSAPQLSAAERKAALAQSDEVRNAVIEAEWKRELDFRARGLSLAIDVDSIEVTRAMLPARSRSPDGSLPITTMPIVNGGLPCSGASDKQACQQALTQKQQAQFAHLKCQDHECPEFDFVYALTTRGDEVRTYSGQAELAQLFGSIDTPVEAWITLVAHGLSNTFTCDDVERASHRLTSAGHEISTRMHTSTCYPITEKLLTYQVTTDGQIKLLRERVLTNDPANCIVSGRRPEGLLAERYQVNAHSDAGALFARMAHLEHASVFAFEILHDELEALGADAPLLARVTHARDDEARHVRSMGHLAQHFGAEPVGARVERKPLRAALDIALENSREGCVRELYGALLAGFQAERAADPNVRTALSDIAQDEVRHAALSWELADWLDARLSPAERDRVAFAREQALTELAAELTEPSPAERTWCGLPSLHEARGLLAEVRGFATSAVRC